MAKVAIKVSDFICNCFENPQNSHFMPQSLSKKTKSNLQISSKLGQLEL
jgi:hypothetical protein